MSHSKVHLPIDSFRFAYRSNQVLVKVIGTDPLVIHICVDFDWPIWHEQISLQISLNNCYRHVTGQWNIALKVCFAHLLD